MVLPSIPLVIANDIPVLSGLWRLTFSISKLISGNSGKVSTGWLLGLVTGWLLGLVIGYLFLIEFILFTNCLKILGFGGSIVSDDLVLLVRNFESSLCWFSYLLITDFIYFPRGGFSEYFFSCSTFWMNNYFFINLSKLWIIIIMQITQKWKYCQYIIVSMSIMSRFNWRAPSPFARCVISLFCHLWLMVLKHFD